MGHGLGYTGGLQAVSGSAQTGGPVAGFYLLGNRLYDTSLGRFLSQDPLHGSTALPLSLNRSTYARNNPTTLTDPTGTTPSNQALASDNTCNNPIGWLYCAIVNPTLGPGGSLLMLPGLFHGQGEGGGGGGDFRGPSAKEFDWEHIFANHAPWGAIARQRTSDTATIFEGLTAGQIKARVQSAWKYRDLIETQARANGDVGQRYRGTDPVSGQTIEFWFNRTSRVVETAYPVH